MRAPALSALGQAALAYAARGWPVFPCHSIDDGRCTCDVSDCGSPGKHPRTKNGLKDASTETAAIRNWWGQWPDANVAVVMGHKAGIVVVDVDPRNGGTEHMTALGLTAARTRMVATGGGGWHLWFRPPRAVKSGKLAPGVDFQAEGKYVIAPPSVHASGACYEWLNPDDPIDALPNHLAKQAGPSDTGPKASIILPTRHLWLTELFQDGYRVPAGARNDTLTRIAGFLRVTWPYEPALAILQEWNRWHCDPPLSTDEVEKCIAHKYQRYAGWEDIANQAWTVESLLLADFPEPKMIVEDILAVGLNFIAGRPKIGKSFLVMQLGLDVATGTQSFGKAVDQGSVIGIFLEDSSLRIQKRLRRMGADPSTRNFTILTKFPALDEGGLAELEGICKDRPKLVIVDTFARIASVKTDPNKTQDITAAMAPIQELAHDYGVALTVVDHHRKSDQKRARDVREDITGSIAKSGVADAIWGLYRDFGSTKGEFAGTGRDIEEREFAVDWDALKFRWKLTGEKQEMARQSEYGRVLQVVDDCNGQVGRKGLVETLKVSWDKADRLLGEMVQNNMLVEHTVPSRGTNGEGRLYRRPSQVSSRTAEFGWGANE